MANFGKFANLSLKGWNKTSSTQTITVGHNAHIGLWGGAPGGADLEVKSDDSTICVTHEEHLPDQKKWPHWRHFLLTGLRDGVTKITAKIPGTTTVFASMSVRVLGHGHIRLVFFPGERVTTTMLGATRLKVTMGTIYVIGGHGEYIRAAGGPPLQRADRGGHVIDPTPPGEYVLGPRVHVTTTSWPTSVIRWGAPLRINAKGEVEYANTPGHWQQATGMGGTVTRAQVAFNIRNHKQNPGVKIPPIKDVINNVRSMFIDPVSKKLYTATWQLNDFGVWGWRLYHTNGKATGYFIHTTPDNEQDKTLGLFNSHGCIHVRPVDRDRLWHAGFLKKGVHLEVRPYSEKGPP